MNWLNILLRVLTAVPHVVAGVEAMHKGASGSTKKDLAMQALGLAGSVTNIITPENQAITDAITNLASQTIDNTVTAFNQAGVFTKTQPAIAAPTETPQNPKPAAPKPATVAAVRTMQAGRPVVTMKQKMAEPVVQPPPEPTELPEPVNEVSRQIRIREH